MSPRIPNHGTNHRYNFYACRCDACKLAHYRAMKRYRAGYSQRTIDATGAQRRLQALMWLGWPSDVIAARMGISKGTLAQIRLHTRIYSGTAERVAVVYDELSMTPGPSRHVKGAAIRRGHVGPLAWDDETIDDPNAEPYKPAPRKDWTTVDQVLVQRALDGIPVDANPAERLEVARRWQAAGKSLASLNEIQGWNVHRDLRKVAAA